MNFNRLLKTVFLTGLLILLSFSFFNVLIPTATSRLDMKPKEIISPQKQRIQLVAVGDSLTQGVGDETNKGGFVPLLANSLETKFPVNPVEIENFGVSGNRSPQILKRVKSDEKLQKNLETADIITLTVGGNDLMRVIQNNILGLSVDTFKKPGEKYQKNLQELLDEIRTYNSKAPIYVLGIYNPFYIYFPEITEMQEIVNNWNRLTESVVDQEDQTYFVPINDLIYQGIFDTNDATVEEEVDASTLNDLRNNALYEEDKFHPNFNGYQLISMAFLEKITETSDDWLTEVERDE
ncbi:SGNH/GDSL hydrolase family protein [Enterococcus alcedinis]|uniref:Lipase/acylhydrolase n=1 Tax=Enterococcus alcedinis TaxID=1274384 RepID=A0A917JD86_9ENTE|nr:SGNH/GDSL hydrolase family protein [Enterococcus alcedinis]MBP2101177.1 lysophospholipase L1-like esterase [Enterococcus alcedinis]GGI64524.1 lipase/acylhydrolase [Enterococcus alcedinis]